MALTPAQGALIAFQRFGLGAKPSYGPAQIGSDAKAALIAEVNTPGIALIDNSNKKLPSPAKACKDSQSGFDRAETNRQLEMSARVDKHMAVPIGFVERLVIFWSNHFAMTVNKDDTVRGLLGQWERDVCRKHVLGNFEDMLKATSKHTAMIDYLDNEDSTRYGLNENLAREIMELHTVGSGSGVYGETDVTNFAKILTGWTYVRSWWTEKKYDGLLGQVYFRADWHEPGDITLFAAPYTTTYPAAGGSMLDDVLHDLAINPWTAQHIAFKLVRHFITDEPTQAMVDAIKNKFITTAGASDQLKQVALALLDLPEAWQLPLTKFRTPYEMQIAHYRALGDRYTIKDGGEWVFREPLNALYQVPWEVPSPEGFSDETPTWLNPDSLRVRLDIAQLNSWEFKPNWKGDPVALADRLFGDALSAETKARITTAVPPDPDSPRNDALTILLSCPEFQRR